MKKLHIVLVLGTSAIKCDIWDSFEKLHQNLNDHFKEMHEEFDKLFKESSFKNNQTKHSGLNLLDIQNKDNAIEIKLQFDNEPKGSIEAQKKSLKGSFEADGFKLDLNLERNKAHKYLDNSYWVLKLEGNKTEIKRSASPKSEGEKPEEKTYSSKSQYSSIQTINADLDDLKTAKVEQNGNIVTILLQKKSAEIKKIELQQKIEPTKIEIAKKQDSDDKELG